MLSLLKKAVLPRDGEYLTGLGRCPGALRRLAFPLYRLLRLPDVVEIGGVKVPVATFNNSECRGFAFGSYEVSERLVAERIITPNDVVVEFGAGSGYIAASLAKKLSSRSITVFEPNPRLHDLIKNVAQLNGISVSVFPIALAQSNGPVDFVIQGSFLASSLKTCINGEWHDGDSVLVQGGNLQTLLAVVPNATMIVLDVEGAEQYIDWQQVPRNIRKLAIEFHPKLPHYNMQKILDGIRGADFIPMESLNDGHVQSFIRR
jgi:FkbM family methyltransferase